MIPNKYEWITDNTKDTTDILGHILDTRNILDKDKFLSPTIKHLYDPYLLADMSTAVERILIAKDKGEHVTIYGDYDVDGITSTSILYMFLKSLGIQVDYYIPDRISEGYGINISALKNIAKTSSLVITVDTGIAAVKEIEAVKELDVIVTDHHECQEVLPNAYCIINPKRPDCQYPCEVLAGVGVTFKLIQAIAMKLDIVDTIWKYLDIVAIGTIADLVPLVDENRTLTWLGFRKMENTTHIGVKALLDVIGKSKITASLIGFQVAPRINAIGRLGDAKIGVELLTCTDAVRAEEIAKFLDEENTTRKEMEKQIFLAAEAYIDNNLLDRDVIVVAGEGWHHGVIGIVASKIVSKYYKPTIVFTLEDGVYTGSARSVTGFSMFDALVEEDKKGLLLRFGGHDMAAGLSIEQHNFETFRNEFVNSNEHKLTQEILTPKMKIDAVANILDINLELYNELEKLEPLGMSNPTPKLEVSGTVKEIMAMGKDMSHLKISICEGAQVVDTVGFGQAEYIHHIAKGDNIVIAGTLDRNEWKNKVKIQLHIKAIKSTDDVESQSKRFLELYKNIKNPIIVEKSSATEYFITEKEILEKQHSEKNSNTFGTQYPKICYNNKTYVCGTNELLQMIPTHDDCKILYRHLRDNRRGVISLNKIQNMTEYKFLQILDIFAELQFISYKIKDSLVYFKINQAPKTTLENSQRFVLLQQCIPNN
ncbi:MAG: single-stranded-DNA-specific exonuclease RecJ [Epulopiscium sp. Nele67-Bin004]|nr:MAG: single-stranded-DNA-specific exonuclease RecJ [Epulopiscium sp. Nele67-Bin004]